MSWSGSSRIIRFEDLTVGLNSSTSIQSKNSLIEVTERDQLPIDSPIGLTSRSDPVFKTMVILLFELMIICKLVSCRKRKKKGDKLFYTLLSEFFLKLKFLL